MGALVLVQNFADSKTVAQRGKVVCTRSHIVTEARLDGKAQGLAPFGLYDAKILLHPYFPIPFPPPEYPSLLCTSNKAFILFAK